MNQKNCERCGKIVDWLIPDMGRSSLCKECYDELCKQYQIINEYNNQRYSMVIKRFRKEKKPSNILFDTNKEDIKLNKICIVSGKPIDNNFLVNVCGEMVHPTICKEVFDETIKKYNILEGPSQYRLVMKKLKIVNITDKDKRISELEKRLAELEKKQSPLNKNNFVRSDAYPIQYTNKTANGDYSIRCKYKGRQATFSLFSLPKEMKEEQVLKYCVKIKNVICLAINGEIGKDNT
jgi:hypothetical protein